MSAHIFEGAKYEPHPVFEGVFVKHFYNGEDTGRLNDFEITIVPGFEIKTHKHENTAEFFYVVSGKGEFLDETEWKPISAGNAMMAPVGMTHAIKNTGEDPLKIFACYSPAIR
ncbi:MAG: cupin domain-containing protein [Fusobacteriaceae bacterium]|jgi:mannose-6-phosphate isomerase-like protein (cupin superfamily)|nr:cupin domain-containing protein [Fusobacteriaceae bacterium]